MKTPRLTLLPLVALIVLITSGLTKASVTLTIGTSGWGDSTATSVNGMAWGILVNTSGSFNGSTISTLQSALQGFTIPTLSASVSTPVQIGSTGLYFARAQSNTSNSGPPTFTNGFMFTDNFNLTGVSSGNPFGVLWFPEGTTTSGSHFGFQVPTGTNTLPSDGATITSGIGTTPGLGTNTIGAVPEPSRAILAAFGLGLIALRRRRR
jgi:hypothetical protein